MNKAATSLFGIAVSLLLAGLVAWSGSQGGVLVGSLPLFTACVVAAIAIQWLCFIPAFVYQTERYYDLVGSLTYLSLLGIGLMFSSGPDVRSWLIASMVAIWAIRLGSFLFLRIRADGRDVRFERIKPDLLRFLMTWTLQGLWVTMTFSAGLAAITSGQQKALDVFLVVGAALWLFGFAIEVLADRQKRQFRREPDNTDRFITTGLWKYSRHPNYFGEILLWLGIAVVAFPVLQGWQLLTLVSPVFVYVLLTRVSGIPMLEAAGRRRWGEDPSYQDYMRRTPRLVPGFPVN